ncbi:flagellar protein FliT [Paraburkholderia hospita]|uniref:flagellar protein FliT n=1 Tax=Paraburkholderia hospita TaxID=169430 RepID=UPI000271D754|nr:flagellar protein FliT [Paraburkholderia hospita]EUC21293.1 flagellar export chaperone [Burkholderia sp. BT03]SKC94866.1 protein FliT [Paraburkholderia hospita]
MTNTEEPLVHAVRLTHAIDSAVQQGDWLRAEALVAERSPLLMSLQPDQPQHALAMIREIQTLDAQITAHSKAGFDTLSNQNAEAIQRIKSTHQYLKIGMQM